jgi:hypothetical protein
MEKAKHNNWTFFNKKRWNTMGVVGSGLVARMTGLGAVISLY